MKDRHPYFYTLTTTDTPAGPLGALLGLWSESSGLSGPVLRHLVDPSDLTDTFLDSWPSRVELYRVPFYHLSPGSPPRRSADRCGSVYRSSETGRVLLCDRAGWFIDDPEPYSLQCLVPVPGVESIGTGAAVRLPAALWSSLSGSGGP